jgi:drug/metabolite transporter (DMT)-like permease
MNNIFKTFNKEISWNTKFYVLLVILMVVFSYVFRDHDGGYFLGSVIALLCVLLLDLYLILSKKYTDSWRWIKIVIVITILALTLISMIS